MAATNRDLKKATEENLFRDDLYFRLSAFPITIPPLRSRRGDIPLLAEHYLERFCREMGKPRICISEESAERLQSYDWPGNVRELANCMERAVILCDGEELTPQLLGFGSSRTLPPPPSDLDLTGTLAQVGRRASASAEKVKIEKVLKELRGDRSLAAKKLQVSA